MNFNDDYQKPRGQKHLFLQEIIEPNRKYLECNLFNWLSNLFYGEYLGRYRKVKIRNIFAKKKDPIKGLLGFY